MFRSTTNFIIAGVLVILTLFPPHGWIDLVLAVEAGAIFTLGLLTREEEREENR